MIKSQIFGFILRWIISSLGMYLCITWFGAITELPDVSQFTGVTLFIVAGLIFSLLNSIIKPIIKLFALPLAILTMGISTVIINTAMVALTVHLLPGVSMELWGMVISSEIMSFMNGIINALI